MLTQIFSEKILISILQTAILDKKIVFLLQKLLLALKAHERSWVNTISGSFFLFMHTNNTTLQTPNVSNSTEHPTTLQLEANVFCDNSV